MHEGYRNVNCGDVFVLFRIDNARQHDRFSKELANIDFASETTGKLL